MTVRQMIVVRAPGTNSNPMIRVSNSYLVLAGFIVGTQFEITYQSGLITIRKLKKI